MELIQKELLYAALGTGATCLATVLGAAMVFFFRHAMSHILQKAFLGFAAGVMIAASVWSLLIPAMGRGVLLPVGGGFVLGGAFLMLLDNLLPHLHIGSDEAEGLPAHWKRTTMIVLAVTLHNIPEGMAVGLSFSVAAQDPAPGALAGAVALAIGMGLQNFPEGAAVSLPMKSQGVPAGKAFLCGAASGVVEPVFGLITVLVAGSVGGMLPWVLSFAAGAMIYSHAGTLSVMGGFLVMMLLDVLLGT